MPGCPRDPWPSKETPKTYCWSSILFLVSFRIIVKEHRHACMYYVFMVAAASYCASISWFPFESMQAFSLDFNLRSHMKTHSQENYHICPYPECGKRYAHEYKLKNHISSTHQKVCNLLYCPYFDNDILKVLYEILMFGLWSKQGAIYPVCTNIFLSQFLFVNQTELSGIYTNKITYFICTCIFFLYNFVHKFQYSWWRGALYWCFYVAA